MTMFKLGLSVFLLISLATDAMAQQQSDRFLAEVFAINTFKMNSTLLDVKKDKQIAGNLSFLNQIDNRAVYHLTNQQINLPGLKSLDRLAFDTVELTFENNKLHDVDLYVPASFRDIIFKKSCDQFNAKYGQAVVLVANNNNNNNDKKYVWNLGANELTLHPFPSGLLIHYASKILNKKIGWIYSDRKGEGNGTIQLNLPYFEKLLSQKMTIGSFEKLLPQWRTIGIQNHIFYQYNFNTKVDNSPSLSVTYFLSNYEIYVSAEHTTSEVISQFRLEKIKDSNFWRLSKKYLDSTHYIQGPKPKYSKSITYSNHKFLIFFDKEDSRISIMNDFKF